MRRTLLVICIITLNLSRRSDYAQIVQEVNDIKGTWVAGLNQGIQYDNEELLFMQASGSVNQDAVFEAELHSIRRPRFLQKTTASFLTTFSAGLFKTLDINSYPQTLDLRSKYPRCRSIPMIRNQAACASCWAFAAMNSSSDTYCISMSTPQKTEERFFSPQDSLECCPTCYVEQRKACSGGYLYQAFKHAKTDGIVKGDGFDSNSLCKPYFMPESFRGMIIDPICTRSCNPLAVNQDYLTDKLKIKDFVYGKGVDDMVKALNTIGSIAITMKVYQDLYTYQSGVYSRSYGAYVGGHAIRLIGYGVENGVPYWLAANSWGVGWGERGFFKIKKGTDESGIETGYFFAAIFK